MIPTYSLPDVRSHNKTEGETGGFKVPNCRPSSIMAEAHVRYEHVRRFL